jgi:hypothetical protein
MSADMSNPIRTKIRSESNPIECISRRKDSDCASKEVFPLLKKQGIQSGVTTLRLASTKSPSWMPRALWALNLFVYPSLGWIKMFLNACKYRFASFAEEKSDGHYLVKGVNREAALIASSTDLLALGVGSATSGRFLVLPTDHSQFTRSDNPKVYVAHSGEVADLQFSPFSASGSLLASLGRSDGAVKLWDVQADLAADVSEPIAAVKGLGAALNSLQWHPSADSVVAVAGKSGVDVVDLHEQKTAFTLAPGADPEARDWLSCSWNWDGSLLGLVGKQGAVVVGDARAQVGAWQAGETKGAGIDMPHTCQFGGRDAAQQCLYVFGTSRARGAMVAVYDPRNLDKALSKVRLSLSLCVCVCVCVLKLTSFHVCTMHYLFPIARLS